MLGLSVRKRACGGLEGDGDLSEATEPEEATAR